MTIKCIDMIEFRTPVAPLKGHETLISHDRAVVMLGSCFSDNVGHALQRDMLDCDVNPFGTLYNPASIAGGLLDLLYGRSYTLQDLFQHEGVWHSFAHHSAFSGTDPEEVLGRINRRLRECAESLSRASVLVVTFGTAWIFREKASNKVVANCHKLHPDTFTREMLTVTSIAGLWKKMLREVAARYPDLKVIFTVSPIRHLADGAHGNQLSKSTLLLAVDKLCAEFPNIALYFPAYEIMMDDLRDYRFYAADMVHPSDVAVKYIYDVFKHSFMDEATMSRAKELAKVTAKLSHRPLTQDADTLSRIKAENDRMVQELLAKYPFLQRALARLGDF